MQNVPTKMPIIDPIIAPMIVPVESAILIPIEIIGPNPGSAIYPYAARAAAIAPDILPFKLPMNASSLIE